MSEYAASTLRDKMKAKAKARAAGEGPGKVDASSYEVPEALDANIQTGMRPVSRQRFKKGGAVEGDKAESRADRAPRKSGGLVNDFINRNDKDANEERPGKKHRGGFATGGAPNADHVPTSRFGFQPAESRLAKAAGLKNGGKVRTGNRKPRGMGGVLKAVSPAAALVEEDVGFISPVAGLLSGKKDREKRASGGSISDKMQMGRTVDKPLADKGLTSYRARGPNGHIAIGAKDHDDALREARRSNPSIQKSDLDVWDGNSYEPIVKERKRGGSVSDGTLQGARPTGGRLARQSGGAAKGKTNINIVIAPQGGAPGGPPMSGGELPPPPPPMPKPPMPPPGGPMAGPPPGGGPMPPPMPRKRGGRAIQHGAGGGLGRLEKIKAYGDNAKP